MSFANNTPEGVAGETMFHMKHVEMTGFDLLGAELRELLNYGPVNQSAVPLVELAIRSSQPEAAEQLRDAYRTNFPDWTPDLAAPDLGLSSDRQLRSGEAHQASSVGGTRRGRLCRPFSRLGRWAVQTYELA